MNLHPLEITLGGSPIDTISVEDAFVWTGSLREAPEWLQEMVFEDDAIITKRNKMLSIKYKNGYVQADPGAIVIRINKDNYSVIHANKNL